MAKNRVRRLRGELGWSQSDLSERLGISSWDVHALEGGSLAPPASHTNEIAELVGQPVERVFPTEHFRRTALVASGVAAVLSWSAAGANSYYLAIRERCERLFDPAPVITVMMFLIAAVVTGVFRVHFRRRRIRARPSQLVATTLFGVAVALLASAALYEAVWAISTGHLGGCFNF